MFEISILFIRRFKSEFDVELIDNFYGFLRKILNCISELVFLNIWFLGLFYY